MAKGKRRNPGHPARAAGNKAAPARDGKRADAKTSERGMSPRTALVSVLGLVGVLVASYFLFGSSSGETEDEPASDPTALRVPWVDPEGTAPIVGAVDVNPADESLWLATNTGLWRIEADGQQPEQVTGDLTTDLGRGPISEQLVVRFRGPDRMLASGHPPADSELPPALGLIESRDAGKSWTPVSGAGQKDFHAIQALGNTVVAGNFGERALDVSHDAGKTFETRAAPAPIVDLAVDPDDTDRWIASTFEGLITSTDEGRTWREREPIPSIRFAWPAGGTLHRIEPGGLLKVSTDRGESWREVSSTGGEPQAMFAPEPEHLYVALVDGTVKESTDGGETWTDRVSPPA